MDKIKINTLLNSLYNKMNKTEKKKFEKDLVLLSKELFTKSSYSNKFLKFYQEFFEEDGSKWTLKEVKQKLIEDNIKEYSLNL